MKYQPYNPFQSINFRPDICFLTGEKLHRPEEQKIPVFPLWLIERYELQEKSIGMLGGNRLKYNQMMLPASDAAQKAITDLDAITQKAFESGYESVAKLPELTLFQWMARILYGVLYQDFAYAISRHELRGKEFQMAPLMTQKLKNLLLMLQSLLFPVRFENFSPWTIRCFRVNVSKDILNYKDETHNLNFCLGMNGFGIIACLQDNEEVGQFYESVLAQIGDTNLHPAQFEELYGRFMYANYLLRELPDYPIREENDTLIFRLPKEQPHQVKFAKWEDETFAQVLANLWQPWGIPLEKIYRFPDSPISFLINETTHKLIPPEKVKLPY